MIITLLYHGPYPTILYHAMLNVMLRCIGQTLGCRLTHGRFLLQVSWQRPVWFRLFPHALSAEPIAVPWLTGVDITSNQHQLVKHGCLMRRVVTLGYPGIVTGNLQNYITYGNQCNYKKNRGVTPTARGMIFGMKTTNTFLLLATSAPWLR